MSPSVLMKRKIGQNYLNPSLNISLLKIHACLRILKRLNQTSLPLLICFHISVGVHPKDYREL